MEIILYKTSSPSNTINKKLEYELKLENVIVKGDFNILNPILDLKYNVDILTKNYCYIPSLNRYYFINNLTIFPNKIITIEINIDLLETYKDTILKSSGLITQNNAIGSLSTNGIETTQEKTITETEIPITFNNEYRNILIAGYRG